MASITQKIAEIVVEAYCKACVGGGTKSKVWEETEEIETC
jgi:hypothetical protein